MQATIIESIYSVLSPDTLLHQLVKCPETSSSPHKLQRQNISPEDQSLQLAYLELPLGQTFKAHKHVLFPREMPRAQESWIVINGKVEVHYYDLDDSLIQKSVISAGECTITYQGGHNYVALEKGTVVYEVKTGPYLGVEKDKTFLSS